MNIVYSFYRVDNNQPFFPKWPKLNLLPEIEVFVKFQGRLDKLFDLKSERHLNEILCVL
jgi:hypothetical protein